MAKFSPGDEILVNGTKMTLGSWPEDDLGPFTATYRNTQGGEVYGTYWAGQVTTEGEPQHTSASVTLVAPGDGVESSIPADVLAKAEAELADLEAQVAADAERVANEQHLIDAIHGQASAAPVPETPAE